ncbi:hypothetical protein D9M72_633500 [compost metagenome]
MIVKAFTQHLGGTGNNHESIRILLAHQQLKPDNLILPYHSQQDGTLIPCISAEPLQLRKPPIQLMQNSRSHPVRIIGDDERSFGGLESGLNNIDGFAGRE